jgi:hypothetical protein
MKSARKRDDAQALSISAAVLPSNVNERITFISVSKTAWNA